MQETSLFNSETMSCSCQRNKNDCPKSVNIIEPYMCISVNWTLSRELYTTSNALIHFKQEDLFDI